LSGFATAHQIATSVKNNTVSTGSPELDTLIGGVVGGVFYLFYGEEDLVEQLFPHLIVGSLAPRPDNPTPRVIYGVCGNYRIERNIIDVEPLTHMIQGAGLTSEEALSRVRILTASSADQQSMLADALEADLIRGGVALAMIKGIYKLQLDDARKRGREKVAIEMQTSITKMKSACSTHGVPLIASTRPVEAEMMPRPEASSYLDHLANVIVYLRRRDKRGAYNKAFLLKSPTRPMGSTEYRYKEPENMGRVTPPIRMSFNDLVARLRGEYRDAIVKPVRRDAFDRLVEAWSSELGAVTYAESIRMLDLMLLTAAVENRRLIQDLHNRLDAQEKQVNT